MSEQIKPKTLPGFMELLPSEQILFNRMKDTIKNTYESYGFLPLNTPIIEDAKILLAKAGGETEKQIYRFYQWLQLDLHIIIIWQKNAPIFGYHHST